MTPWAVNLAVDGRYMYTDLSAGGGQCAISTNTKHIAEWRVDLGEVLSIQSLFIQHRTDKLPWAILSNTSLKMCLFFLVLFMVYCISKTEKSNFVKSDGEYELKCIFKNSDFF